MVSQDLHFDPDQLGNSVLSRNIALSGGLLLVAVSVILPRRPPRPGAAIALMACVNLLLPMAPQNCRVLIQEIEPTSQVGGGYTASFVLAGVLAVAGALAVRLVVRSAGPIAKAPAGA